MDPFLNQLYGVGELGDYLGEFAAAARPTVVRKGVTATGARATVGTFALEDVIAAYQPSFKRSDLIATPNATKVAYVNLARSKGLNASIMSAASGGVQVDAGAWQRLVAQKPAPRVGPPAPPPSIPKSAELVKQQQLRNKIAAETAATQSASKAKTALENRTTGADAAGMVKRQVRELQQMLVRLGAKLGTPDGLFGPKTAAAWTAAAAGVNAANTSISRASKTEAWVDPLALDAVRAAASRGAGGGAAPRRAPLPAAAAQTAARAVVAGRTRSTRPSGNNSLRVKVETVQQVVVQYKGKIAIDGTWGPKTAAAWTALARAKGLDGRIDRAGPDEAWVVPAAWEKLAGGPAVSTATSTQKTEVISIGAAQDVLTKLGGVYGARDGKYGQKTASAWRTLVVTQGNAALDIQCKRRAMGNCTPSSLTGVFERVDGFNARVESGAWSVLQKLATKGAAPSVPAPTTPQAPMTPSKRAVIEAAAKQLVAKAKADKVVLSVAVIQQAALEVAASRSTRGVEGLGMAVAPRLYESGRWDSFTETAFLNDLWNVKGDIADVWRAAIPQLLNASQTTLRVPKAQVVAQIEAAAKRYKARAKAEAQSSGDLEPRKTPLKRRMNFKKPAAGGAGGGDTDTTPDTPTLPLPQQPPVIDDEGIPSGQPQPPAEPDVVLMPTTPAPAGGGTDVTTGGDSTTVNVPATTATQASMFEGNTSLIFAAVGIGALLLLRGGSGGGQSVRVDGGGRGARR